MNETQQFEAVVAQWQAAEVAAIEARFTYESEFAQAVMNATGSNEAARKADATLCTLATKKAAELVAVEAKARFQMVLFLGRKLAKVGTFGDSDAHDFSA